MQKATVTYVAPVGDSKVVEMGGVTFFDGKSVEINSYDNPRLLEKLQGNQYFDINVSKEDNQPPPKVKRGRPSKADIEAAKAAADRAEKEAQEAKTKAEQARSDSEKMEKATDTEVTKPPTEGRRTDVKAGVSQAASHDFEKDRQDEIARRDAQAKDQPKGEPGVLGLTGTSPSSDVPPAKPPGT
jgi:hypothetical protein